jgi:hypothetical protein
VSAPHGKAFVLGGRLMGHVLDPRTGRPAGTAVSACVIGPSSAIGDALSTALLVSGTGAPPWLTPIPRLFRVGGPRARPTHPVRSHRNNSGAAHTLALAAAVLLPIFASAPLPETSTARCAFSSATHHRQHPCRHRSSRAARAPVRFSIY